MGKFTGILGIVVLLGIAYLLSNNRKNINYRLVAWGLGIQLIFALLILKSPIGKPIFFYIDKIITKLISFSDAGSDFLFKSFVPDVGFHVGLINFAFRALPTIIFFSGLMAVMYHFGIIQFIVKWIAKLMQKTMGTSGSETLSVSANIFVGQTEAPLMVRPFVNNMTKSELAAVMTGGFATAAGGVLALYVMWLKDIPGIAGHLLAASVMSAPAAIVVAKMLLPEKEKFETKLEVSKADMGANALEAISKGTTDGLRLAVNVGAMLLVFIALMSMANFILFKVGDWTSLNAWIATNTRYPELSFNMILGYIGAPIAWLIGVCKEDMFLVGQLLGEKTVLNEFVGYMSLGEMKNAGEFVEQKSIIIATYILCGFANFASIGIQIGGIGALAPKRRGDLSKLGVLALIAGTLASLFTAVIVGMLI